MTSSVAQFADWIAQDMTSEVDEHVYYLSGPMSGFHQANFPLFQRAAQTLREKGFQIISPVELDQAESKKAGNLMVKPWGHYIGRDVSLIIQQCDGIIVLPQWEASPGCRIEMYVALTQGHSLMRYIDADVDVALVQLLGKHKVMRMLSENTVA